MTAKDESQIKVIKSQAARMRQINEAILSPLLTNDPIFKQLQSELTKFFNSLSKQTSLVFDYSNTGDEIPIMRIKLVFYSGLLDIIEQLCLAFQKVELKAFKDVLATTFQWH